MVAHQSNVVRVVLTSLLREDGRFDLVAEVETGEGVLHCENDVDVVLTDLVLDDTDAFALMDDLSGSARTIPVVIFSGADAPYLRAEARSRGAGGFYSQDDDPAMMLDGLAEAARFGSAS